MLILQPRRLEKQYLFGAGVRGNFTVDVYHSVRRIHTSVLDRVQMLVFTPTFGYDCNHSNKAS